MRNTMAPRWGDHDTYVGPFTFARDRSWRPFSIMVTSADDEDRKCRLRLSGFGFTFLAALPSWVLQPERQKVFPKWDAATINRLGRDWYWAITEREFGVTCSDGHLSVHFGRQTCDSSTEQRWGCFLPWTQWRHVRHSLYVLDGSHFVDLPEFGGGRGPESWEWRRLIEGVCPTATFTFRDYDGEELTAATKIEEREWRRGTGWCRWLSLFTKSKVRRSLDIRFSGETGKRKGSWKGGTVGHSIEMEAGELHEAAFRRYCAAHNMTFIS